MSLTPQNAQCIYHAHCTRIVAIKAVKDGGGARYRPARFIGRSVLAHTTRQMRMIFFFTTATVPSTRTRR